MAEGVDVHVGGEWTGSGGGVDAHVRGMALPWAFHGNADSSQCRVRMMDLVQILPARCVWSNLTHFSGGRNPLALPSECKRRASVYPTGVMTVRALAQTIEHMRAPGRPLAPGSLGPRQHRASGTRHLAPPWRKPPPPPAARAKCSKSLSRHVAHRSPSRPAHGGEQGGAGIGLAQARLRSAPADGDQPLRDRALRGAHRGR